MTKLLLTLKQQSAFNADHIISAILFWQKKRTHTKVVWVAVWHPNESSFWITTVYPLTLAFGKYWLGVGVYYLLCSSTIIFIQLASQKSDLLFLTLCMHIWWPNEQNMITKPDPAQWFERAAIRSTRLLPATAACVQTHVNKPITLQTLSNLLSVTVSKRMSCKESPIVQLLQTRKLFLYLVVNMF